MKEEWADTHLEFIAKEEENRDTLLIYSDGSLSERKGRRHTSYRVVGYNQGRKVFEASRATGEHSEVFNMV